MTWHPEKILIVGKAYPQPSAKHIETVCTGGVAAEGKWRRLYPIDYRYLEEHQKYKTWDWIRADVSKYEGDPRAESITVRQESIEVLGPEEKASGRWAMIRPLMSRSHEELDRVHAASRNSVTMGAIEIRMDDLTWERHPPDPAMLSKLNQEHFFVRKKPLTVLPLKLILHFHCADDSQCKGHSKSILAWDVQQAYLNWREDYGEENALERLRAKAHEDLDPVRRVPIALLSTIKDHADSWSIGGFFYPRREETHQGTLTWDVIPP